MQSEDFNYNIFYTLYDAFVTEIRNNYIDKEEFGSNYRAFKSSLELGTYLPRFTLAKNEPMIKGIESLLKKIAEYLLQNLQDRLNDDDLIQNF